MARWARLVKPRWHVRWWRPAGHLSALVARPTTRTIDSEHNDMNTTEETPTTNERARQGQALNDLLVGRHIERYYWARGDWHIVLPKGQHLVINQEGLGLWLSGFRCGLRAGALA